MMLAQALINQDIMFQSMVSEIGTPLILQLERRGLSDAAVTVYFLRMPPQVEVLPFMHTSYLLPLPV